MGKGGFRAAFFIFRIFGPPWSTWSGPDQDQLFRKLQLFDYLLHIPFAKFEVLGF